MYVICLVLIGVVIFAINYDTAAEKKKVLQTQKLKKAVYRDWSLACDAPKPTAEAISLAYLRKTKMEQWFLRDS